jgi:hypothetical protein
MKSSPDPFPSTRIVATKQNRGDNLKSKVASLIRNQSGQGALAIVLILLLVGAAVVSPLLAFMGTGLKTTQMHEEKTLELYSADAGIEDARWKIQNLPDSLPGQLKNPGDSYNYTEDEQPFVNEMSVGVTIQRIETQGFRVLSTAGNTTVDSVITSVYGDYPNFTDNHITSGGKVELPPHPNVNGSIVENYPDEYWPTADKLSAWYLRDVDEDNPYDSDFIDLDGISTSIGPEYIEGEFDIYNSNNTEATLTLTGTLYIVGKAEVGKSPKDFTLDLNGNTIYVESDLTGGGASGTALWIGRNCTIAGTGCIIVIGDIYFEPNIAAGSEDDYILLMSVDGTTQFNPGSDFYGSIVGHVLVDLQPGVSTWYTTPPTEEEGGLNFPGGGDGGGNVWGIDTWEIILQ